MSSKILRVYQAIVAQSVDGYAELRQDELTKMTGISRRHLVRIVKELQDLGIIKTKRVYGRYRAKTAFFVLSDSTSHLRQNGVNLLSDSTSHLRQNGANHLSDSTSHLRPSKGLQESLKTPMNHDMNDKNKILSELDFINAKNRTLCAGLVDMETARRWRDLWEYCENYDAWGEYGISSNGVGYIVRLIKNGDPVPDKIQEQLPASSLDMSELFVSRGLDKDQIAENHPMAQTGAVLGKDGIWR